MGELVSLLLSVKWCTWTTERSHSADPSPNRRELPRVLRGRWAPSKAVAATQLQPAFCQEEMVGQVCQIFQKSWKFKLLFNFLFPILATDSDFKNKKMKILWTSDLLLHQ